MSDLTKTHPLAGKTVKLLCDVDGQEKPEYRIEDWWIRVAGKSWAVAQGNPACIKYGFRAGVAGVPGDDNVLYGKIGSYGHLIHESELGEVL